MSNSLLDTLLLSSKIDSSEDYDATYESLPVVIAESTKDLDSAFATCQAPGSRRDRQSYHRPGVEPAFNRRHGNGKRSQRSCGARSCRPHNSCRL